MMGQERIVFRRFLEAVSVREQLSFQRLRQRLGHSFESLRDVSE